MDATVVATAHTALLVERTALHRTLRRLTAADVPNRPGAWRRWLASDGGARYRPRDTSGDAGSGPRVHADFLRHTAILRDYDVEVAKTAFIADPVPEVAQEGATIDTESR